MSAFTVREAVRIYSDLQWNKSTDKESSTIRGLWKELDGHPFADHPIETLTFEDVAEIVGTLADDTGSMFQEVRSQFPIASGDPLKPGFVGVACSSGGLFTAVFLDSQMRITETLVRRAPQSLADAIVASNIESIAVDEAISSPPKETSIREVDRRLSQSGLPSRRIPDVGSARHRAVAKLIHLLAAADIKPIVDPESRASGTFETSSKAIMTLANGPQETTPVRLARVQNLASLGVTGFDVNTEDSFRSALSAWVSSLASRRQTTGLGSERDGWVFLPDIMRLTSPDFVAGKFRLSDEALAKGRRYARWLRREIIRFWYSTIEDLESMAISVASATIAINTLDRAVFEPSFGDDYQKFRSADRAGLVVQGLELIRNCEVHAPVVDQNMIHSTRLFSMQVGSSSRVRTTPVWTLMEELKPRFVRDTRPENSRNNRARGQVRAAYRQSVAGREVIETLLDALDFFERMDARLQGERAQGLTYSYGFQDMPGPAGETIVAMPLGLDHMEVFLPDLVLRSRERRMSSWGPADKELQRKAKQIKTIAPTASRRRRVEARVLNATGRLCGLAGVSVGHIHGVEEWWVESVGQINKDVQKGYEYFLLDDTGSEVLLSAGPNTDLIAVESDNLIHALPEDSFRSDETIRFYGNNPDMYIKMRAAQVFSAGSA